MVVTRFFDRFTANLPFSRSEHDVGMLVKQVAQDGTAGSLLFLSMLGCVIAVAAAFSVYATSATAARGPQRRGDRLANRLGQAADRLVALPRCHAERMLWRGLNGVDSVIRFLLALIRKRVLGGECKRYSPPFSIRGRDEPQQQTRRPESGPAPDSPSRQSAGPRGARNEDWKTSFVSHRRPERTGRNRPVRIGHAILCPAGPF